MQTGMQYRRKILEAAVHAGRGHLGGAFSCVEILMAVHSVMTDEDEFILSKGHAAIALYAILFDDLLAFCANNSYLTEHPSVLIPGVRVTTGSLGHGVGIAAGMALAKKLNGDPGHVYVLVGDGECMEGSVYEAVMFSVLQKLNNLTIILDANRVMSTREFPTNVGAYINIFGAMGCTTDVVNGHDVSAMITSLVSRYMAPQFLMANTIKGKGVSFMENSVQWHSGVPTGVQLEIARKELQ